MTPIVRNATQMQTEHNQQFIRPAITHDHEFHDVSCQYVNMCTVILPSVHTVMVLNHCYMTVTLRYVGITTEFDYI